MQEYINYILQQFFLIVSIAEEFFEQIHPNYYDDNKIE